MMADVCACANAFTSKLAGHANPETPAQASNFAPSPQQSAAAIEATQKFDLHVLRRYPELLGKFKVPGRGPGRPKGSKARFCCPFFHLLIEAPQTPSLIRDWAYSIGS